MWSGESLRTFWRSANAEQKRPRSRRPARDFPVEPLETRCLLSADHSPFTIGFDADGREWNALAPVDEDDV
ncbi:MAG: hypothetical protein KDA96_27955, partial [Planctomycetaceae bacterium]|nr:hypothetical protein [Planctomycetaceae bacterium]